MWFSNILIWDMSRDGNSPDIGTAGLLNIWHENCYFSHVKTIPRFATDKNSTHNIRCETAFTTIDHQSSIWSIAFIWTRGFQTFHTSIVRHSMWIYITHRHLWVSDISHDEYSHNMCSSQNFISNISLHVEENSTSV